MRTKVVKLFENETYHDEEATEYYETYYNNVKNFELYESKVSNEEKDFIEDDKPFLRRNQMPRNTINVKGVFKLSKSGNGESPLHNKFNGVNMLRVKKLSSFEKSKKEFIPKYAHQQSKSESSSISSRHITEENESQIFSSQKKPEIPAAKKLTPRFSGINKI
jgi:hypothetical protein